MLWDKTWARRLGPEMDKPYFVDLMAMLDHTLEVLPEKVRWLEALNVTPFDEVRVVILGQDPFHTPGVAHGMAFSTLPDKPIPPSLRNIFREIRSDLGIPLPSSGYLMPWAQQGVLLLNTVLTIEPHKPSSHKGWGWEIFTRRILEMLNEQEHIVFMLWGKDAQKAGEFLDEERHLILRAAHPSPFAARNFFGCKHFSKCNDYLISNGHAPIDWSLEDGKRAEDNLRMPTRQSLVRDIAP